MKLDLVKQSPNVIDGSAAQGDLELMADVCVIGSGPGGAVAASILAQAGKDVLLVEEGGYWDHHDFNGREKDVVPKLYQESMQRTTADAGIAILQGRAVGGGTAVNWTTSFRTPRHVVDHWRAHHAVGGFGYADLEPHWDAIERRLAIHQVPEAELNKNNRKLYDGCKALGWQVETLRRNTHQCLQSGLCGLGCPVNAKRSTLVTLIPDTIEAGGRLLHHARIDRLDVGGARASVAHGTLLDAPAAAPSGKRVRIKANRFVLSCGAINTPALLLRSGFDHGHTVGERTFLHPVIASIGHYDEVIAGWNGAPQSAASHHFADRGKDVGFFLEAVPFYPMLMSTALPGFGDERIERARQSAHVAAHIAIAIDGFHETTPGGRVRLRPSGMPLVDYPIPYAIWSAFRFAQERLAELQLASGADHVLTIHDPPLVMKSKDDLSRVRSMPFEVGACPVFTAHQMGGCRMGDDPRTSVVRSEDLRLHGLENVWVMDGSVFPTSLGVNPQESIFGLVRLMATRLAGR